MVRVLKWPTDYLLRDGKLVQVRSYVIFNTVSAGMFKIFWDITRPNPLPHKFKVTVKMSSGEAP